MTFCNTTGRRLAACALAATLGACGGALDDEDALFPYPFAAPPAAAAPALPPLLDDQGHPAGPYALRAQAEALDRTLNSDVVWVNELCCNDDYGQPDAELALGVVATLITVRELDRHAPVFVDLPDRRAAAALADRLGAAGYTRVFLVTD